MISNTISKHAKLPYNQVKGSIRERNALSQKMASNITGKIQEQLVHNDITIANFKRILDDAKPKNIALAVEKNEDKTAIAAIDIVADESEKVIGYSFNINGNDEGRLSMVDMPTIAHEIQHFTDFLYHPKVVAREQKLCSKGLYNAKYEKFFDNEIYVQEAFYGKKDKQYIMKKIENQVRDFLRGNSIEDKVNYLQHMRYNLLFEDRAFRTQGKLAKKLYNKHFDVYEDCLPRENKDYMFREKAELMKKIALDLIQKERGKHKAMLKRQNVSG